MLRVDFSDMTPRQSEPTIYDIIAGQVRRLRFEGQLTQEEVASQMSELGFAWTRVTVAEIEGKQGRRVSIDEWLGLALAFELPATSFLLPDNTVALTDVLVDLDTEKMRLLLHVGTIDPSDEVQKLEAFRHQVEAEKQLMKRQQVETNIAIEERDRWLASFPQRLADAQARADDAREAAKPSRSSTTRGAKRGRST
jgi:transcriptional regulator with XRE-family HTH domain